MKKPKPQNRNRSRLGKLDRELVAAAALGTRVGKIIYSVHLKRVYLSLA